MVIMEADKINKTIVSEFDDVKAIEIIHSKGLVKYRRNIAAGNGISRVTGIMQSRPVPKAVELIKEKLPILKKEIFEDDPSRETE